MSHRDPTHTRKSKQKNLSALKKLPEKKAASRSKKNIIIDVQPRKDLSSVIQLITRSVPDAPRTKMPADLKPMLATLVDEAFSDGDWQFELKLDGYRALAYLKNGKVELRSRNNNSFNKKFGPVYTSLKEWNINAVVDGEIVVLNEEGVPDFNGIQLWEKQKKGQLVFYVFDILWLEGIDLMQEPLFKRRDILRQLIPGSGVVRFSDLPGLSRARG